MDSMRKNH